MPSYLPTSPCKVMIQQICWAVFSYFVFYPWNKFLACKIASNSICSFRKRFSIIQGNNTMLNQRCSLAEPRKPASVLAFRKSFIIHFAKKMYMKSLPQLELCYATPGFKKMWTRHFCGSTHTFLRLFARK